MKREEVDLFEKFTAQLESTHREMSALSKKSPNDAVNAFKLKLINTVLEGCNKLLEDKYKPFADFTTLSEDDLPSNSDVSFIVAHYLECAEKFRADHIVKDGFGIWLWYTDDLNEDDEEMSETAIRTTAPKKLKEK